MEADIGDSKAEGEEVKRIRRRRKRIYQAILKQMEFYFSDANLLKDRFLSKLIKEDPFVDLSVFLTFNKIRALTDNVEDIANALSKSKLLKLSSDRCKVGREKPLNPNYNEDECSIYVENLPLDAKHDWLSDVFSVYGKVAYVSIPKYRQSGKIKGFAFVEFESVEAANRALKAYGAAGCCLPTDMPPENLCSIATFEPGEGKNQVGIVERPVKLEEEQDEKEIEDSKENVTEPESTKEEADDGNCVSPPKEKKKKRKREEDEDANEEPPEEKEKSPLTVKKRRSKEECVSDENEDDVLGASKKKKRKGKSNDEEESSLLEGHTSIEAAEDASPVSKKKIKKSKAGDAEEDSNKADEDTGDSNLASTEESSKDKEKRKRKLEDSENEEEQLEDGNKKAKVEEEEEEEAAVTSDTPEELKEKKKKKRKRNKEKKDKLTEETICLQILSKKEWKRLRNKYLMLQRKNMKQLRAQIMGHRWDGPWKKHGSNGAEMHDEDWQEEAEHREELSEEHTPMDDEKTETKPESSIRVQFTPGVILKVQLKEPLESAKKFKSEVKHLPKSNLIAYIDARDANSIVHLRCETAEAAKDLLEDLPWEDREILGGEEEKGYWDKILQDRDEKIKKKIRVKKRGREKILGKAENLIGKHLRYDN